jgi:hypothetical protein
MEAAMAKGQMKGNKEAKKPTADKPKAGGSASYREAGVAQPRVVNGDLCAQRV